MMRKLLSLGRDIAGTAVIELALTAPILTALLLGMSEMGLAFSAKLKLEQAAQTAIEKVMQGQATPTSPSAAVLRAEAATLADVTPPAVDVTYYLECVNASTGVATASAYTTPCSASQETRRYMKVAITKNYTPMFGLPFSGKKANGTYALTGKTSVRVQ